MLKKIRETKPLIHHITNWVTIYDCAQVVRAIGALPVMAHAREEVADMVKIASALVLNIGTLTTELIDAMLIAGKAANEKNIPIVLDIVGCGATPMRTEACKKLLHETNISILKGNSAEIGSLAGAEAEVRGVEAISVSGNIQEIAKILAKQEKCTVVVTGKEDIITNGERTKICTFGSPKMGEVVGTGCMCASVLGCFAAVESNYVISSLQALSLFGKAGEYASDVSNGPMSFKHNLMDKLST